MTPEAETRPERVDPDSYKTRVMALVGERAPLDVLAETPDRLDALVGDHPAAVLEARPFAGKWTPTEILGHYVDVEWAFGWRTRSIVGDDHPVIVGFDQDRWVAAQRHEVADPAELRADFRALRRVNLAFWRRLTPVQLERTARHEERGEESLGLWMKLVAGHDLWHLDQLERYVAAARA